MDIGKCRLAIKVLCFGRDVPVCENRPVVVTAFGGNYGIAGFTMVVNGSPPRAGIAVVITPYDLESGYPGLARICPIVSYASKTTPVSPTDYHNVSGLKLQAARDALEYLKKWYEQVPRTECPACGAEDVKLVCAKCETLWKEVPGCP